jgi:UDP-glucose 4-epimerase
MKIAISGSEGFIGQALKSKLSLNINTELICIDIKNGDDLSYKKILDRIKEFDVFVHLAALSFVPDSYTKPHTFFDINFNTTLNALELCRKYKAKMIFLSSYVYGKPHYLPIDEKHPINAFNPYAQTKIIGEKLCESYNKDFNVPCFILRPFNIYGPRQNSLFLLPSILEQIKAGQKKILLNDPTPRRDFVNIYDVIEAMNYVSTITPSKK